MKKIRVKRPLIVFAAGLALVAASSVGATRATISYQKEAQELDFTTSTLEVQLLEETSDGILPVEKKLVLEDLQRDFQIGKEYKENVFVKNTSGGEYPEYVRVNVRKSWKIKPIKENEEEEEELGITDTTLSPKLIQLDVAQGWLESEKNAEGAIYYYPTPLAYGDQKPFIEHVTVDNQIWDYVKTEATETENVVQNVYRYDKYLLTIELKVDAVQAHNGPDAILGSWGVNAEFDGDKITKVNGSTTITK